LDTGLSSADDDRHKEQAEERKLPESTRLSFVASWVRRHPWLAAILCLAAAFALLNIVAFAHAWRMTHFTVAGTRTTNPGQMSPLRKLGVLCGGVTVPRPRTARTPDAIGLPYETRNLTTGDGIRIEFWRIACGNPKGIVALFHGYAACKSDLLDEAGAFHALGFECVLADFRGSGGSDGRVTTIGHDEAMDVAAVLRHVRAGSGETPVILYGKSMGAAAILRAIAMEGAHPHAIIIESPFDRMLSTVANRFRSMGLPAFPFSQLLVFWGGAQHGYWGFAHNPVDYAGRVNCPALVMCGSDDPRARPEEVRSVHACLRGEKALAEFPGAGHVSLVRSNPDRWRSEVRGFVSKLRATSPAIRGAESANLEP
jgi:uncharacterized protein